MARFLRRSLVIGVLAVAFAIVAFGLVRQKFSSMPAAPPSRSLKEIRRTWFDEVPNILARFDRSRDAVQARDALVALTVGPAERSVHLHLVLAFQAMIQHQTQAVQLIKAARQEWQSLPSIVSSTNQTH